MDAKDLMVGNYVSAKTIKWNEVPCKVYSIIKQQDDYTKVILEYDGDHSIERWLEEEVDAIPLTEDILGKCGFEKLRESEYTINTYELHGIQVWVNNGQYLLLSKYPIDYLHELQQVFRLLTKQDLQITL